MRVIFVLLIFALISSTGMAQFEPAYHRLSTENGLSCNTIYEIKQDVSGKIFIGHDKGMTVYNGFEFEDYKTPKSTPLKNLIPFAKDKYLVSNFVDELYIMDVRKGSVELFDSTSIKENGFSVYHKLDDHVYRIKNDKIIDFIEGNNVKNKVVYKLNIASSIYNYIIGSNGYSYFRSSDLIFRMNQKSLKVEEYLKVDTKGEMHFFNFQDSIYLFDPIKNRVFNMQDTSAGIRSLDSYQVSDKVTCFYESKDGKFYIGTFQGLYVYDNHFELESKYYTEYQISSITETTEGEMWLGTINDGILIIPSQSSFIWNREKILNKNDKISNVLVDGDKLLVGTYKGKLISLNLNGELTHATDFNLNHEIQGMFADKDSIYAFCKDLKVLDKKDFKERKAYYPFPVKDVLKLNNTIYCATSSGLNFNKGSQNEFREKQFWMRKLEFMSPYLVVESSDGILFYDTTNVLPQHQSLFDEAELKLLHKATKLIENGGGFTVLINNQIWSLNENDLKLEIEFDFENVISYTKIIDSYFLTNGSSIKMYGTNKNPLMIDLSKGLVIRDIQKILNWNDQLLVVGKESIQLLSLPIVSNQLIPVIEVQDVKGTFVQEKGILSSSYHQNLLKIRFEVLPNLKSKGNDVIYYKINGIHSNWQELSSDLNYEISEGRIPNGRYTLEYYAENEDGVRSEISVLQIEVEAPYYLKWWFSLVVSAIVLFLFYIIYKWRISVLNQKNHKKIEEEKLKIKALQSELKALRSQMNPHFIFNTLGVIQSKILNDDTKGAYQNLSTFSKLLRQALMFTTKEFITLNEEIEFIKNYVQLIQARTPNTFKFEVVNNTQVDMNIMFPSLISQPYVENAIRHGLIHKEHGEKLLKLIIEGSNEDFSLIIEDNGIGRKASAKINNEIRENHESFATKAMDSRIVIINLSQPFIWDVNTEDLEVGTKVTIRQQRKKE